MNPLAVLQDCVTVQLTQGKVALIDEATVPSIGAMRWHAVLERRKYFYASSHFYPPGEKRKQLFMHRFIMGNPAGMMVDHRNGDTLDNRRENLRICTRKQNSRNIGVITGKSGHKGVSRRPERRERRWLAYITVDGNLIRLGRFDTAEEASAAYDAAAMKYFGEFARTNGDILRAD